MRRTWLLIACLAASHGCGSAQKSLRPSAKAAPASTPKEYESKDLGAGSSASRRR